MTRIFSNGCELGDLSDLLKEIESKNLPTEKPGGYGSYLLEDNENTTLHIHDGHIHLETDISHHLSNSKSIKHKCLIIICGECPNCKSLSEIGRPCHKCGTFVD